jgi:hypothetical protein
MSPLQRRAALLLLGALLTASCTGAFAASKLYKCVDGGRTVYQQQACPPSAQPEAAASAATKASAPSSLAKASTSGGDAEAVAPRKVTAPSSSASSASAKPR